jgi:hypothetical protein
MLLAKMPLLMPNLPLGIFLGIPVKRKEVLDTTLTLEVKSKRPEILTLMLFARLFKNLFLVELARPEVRLSQMSEILALSFIEIQTNPTIQRQENNSTIIYQILLARRINTKRSKL